MYTPAYDHGACREMSELAEARGQPQHELGRKAGATDGRSK